ncbi:hypothetical protein MPLA_760032 [Mesorhizobium sp. ORS 3359]|nr:hypothetical protein MPLA_760032 [Mesorhizobium sp. ORS 3359]
MSIDDEFENHEINAPVLWYWRSRASFSHLRSQMAIIPKLNLTRAGPGHQSYDNEGHTTEYPHRIAM